MTGKTDGNAFAAPVPADAPGLGIRAAVAAGLLATGLSIVPGLVLAQTSGPAAHRDSSPESPPSATGTGLPAETAVDLQRQLNDLRSDLLDERERRIERRLEANGAVLVVLAIAIGIGGLWLGARLRAIAADARIGAAVARGYVPAPEGLLPDAGTFPPPGGRPGPLRLLHAPGSETGPDTVAMANGNSRPGSVAAHRPPPPGPALPLEGAGNAAGPAGPAPDDDLERREEAIADCSEAIRLDPRNPRLYLERAGLRSGLDRHGEAVADYDRAIGLDPDLAAAYVGRCHAKSALGLHEEAVEDYDRLVLLDPDAAAALADA